MLLLLLLHMENYFSRFLVFFILLVGIPTSTSVPAMFVFGDSILDAGNNNHFILTFAKANFLPYGIDFPAGVTGRFCNGATLADRLSYLLGLGLIPAINNRSTTGSSSILRGVNFASGSSGILNDTAILGGQNIPLPKQVELFHEKILPQVMSTLNNRSAVNDFLAKSLFISNIGNNDYLDRYLLPFAPTFNTTIPPDFAHLLINNYTIELKKLYSYGARKFLIIGLVPLGCVPMVVGIYSEDINQCYEPYNQIAVQFSAKIKSMVGQLNNDLHGAHLVYFDLYSVMKKIIDHPSQYGFKNTHSACCGLGRANGIVLCSPLTYLCPNRSEFFYWDAFHQTDAANVKIFKHAYQGSMQSTYPMNVKQLLEL